MARTEDEKDRIVRVEPVLDSETVVFWGPDPLRDPDDPPRVVPVAYGRVVVVTLASGQTLLQSWKNEELRKWRVQND